MSENNLSLKHQIAGFLPLVAAYYFHGAKTPLFFALPFFLSLYLFHTQVLNDTKFVISRHVLIPFCAYFFWLVVSVINHPPLDHYFFFLSKVVLYLAFGAVIANIRDIKTYTRIGYLIYALAIVEAGLLVLNYDTPGRPVLGQFGGWLKNPLHSGILIPAGTLFGVHLLLKEKLSVRVKIAICASFILIAAAIFLMRSRAAMLSLGIAIVLLIPRRRLLPIFVIAAIIFYANLKMRGWALLDYFEMEQLSNMFSTGRWVIWKTGLMAFLHHPIFGYGSGNFEYAYLHHQQPVNDLLRFGRTTIFAHNGWLQTAVDAGLPALLFLNWAFFNIWKETRNIDKSLPILWAKSTLLMFAISAVFNYSLFLPFNGMIFSTCAGILVSRMRTSETSSIRFSTHRAFIMVLTALFSVFVGANAVADYYMRSGRLNLAVKFMPLSSDIWYEMAQKNATHADTALLMHALACNDKNPFIWSRLARVTALETPNTQKQLINDAYEKTHTIAPSYASFYVEDAVYQLSVGNLAVAEEKFSRAMELEPKAPLPVFGLGLVKLKNNSRAEAQVLFKSAQQLKLSGNKAYESSLYHRELLNSPYGSYLFSVDLLSLDKLIKKSSK